MITPSERVIRITTDERKAEEWALVLAATSIPHRIEEDGLVLDLVVALHDCDAALAALSGYDDEAATVSAAAVEEASAPRSDSAGLGALGAVVAVLLALFHLLVLTRVARARWLERGTAVAERILDGEWWRTVTALTLHADLGHLLGNAAGCVLFVGFLSRRLGVGVASLVFLVGGAAGNALNALFYRSHHNSIGASTAVFAAASALGALEFARLRRRRSARRPAWLPLAASLALLAMLGAAKETDLLAHFFGFLVGGALGLAAAAATPRLPRAGATAVTLPQIALAAASLLAVCGCWLLALR